MWILIWRIAMVVISLVVLTLVVWYIANAAQAARRQSETVARHDQETEPDISDAEFDPAPEEDSEGDSPDGAGDGQ